MPNRSLMSAKSRSLYSMRLITCWIKMVWEIRPCASKSACHPNSWLHPHRTVAHSMLPRNQPIQIILFSATFPDHVRAYSSKFAPNANKIELQKEELSVDSIRQFYMDCRDAEHKYDILVSLYSLLTIGQSIIFCQVCLLPLLSPPVSVDHPIAIASPYSR